jgi:hypothetical protein
MGQKKFGAPAPEGAPGGCGGAAVCRVQHTKYRDLKVSSTGEHPGTVPEGAPAGVAVRLCGAAELAAALQLMQARLHPALAQVSHMVP